MCDKRLELITGCRTSCVFGVLAVFAVYCLLPGGNVLADSLESAGGWRDPLPMMRDPELEPPANELVVDDRLITVWGEALERPEFDLRLNALDGFADLSERGATGLERMLPRIRQRLASDDVRSVRDSAARALVIMGDRESASLLLDAMSTERLSDWVIVQNIDPALVSWREASAGKAWHSRLENDESSSAMQASAARSLGDAGVKSSTSLLVDVTLDADRPMSARFEAAHALGAMCEDGLESVAESLQAQGDAISMLLAISMLESHHNQRAKSYVQYGLSHQSARVREQAVRWMIREGESSVAVIAPFVEDPDSGVRLAAVQAINTVSPESAVAALIKALSDRDQVVRDTAAAGLIEVSSREQMRSGVQAALSAVLSGTDAFAIEQAARIIGYAEMDVEAPRLIGLLGHDSPLIRIAAAEGLRVLKVAGTEPAVLERCSVLTDLMADPPSDTLQRQAIANELAQLFMLLGQRRYEPADALLRRYLPKRSGFGAVDRAAAVYALGLIHEGQASDADLVATLEDRLGDSNPLDPEAPEVRRFSAVALGRMNATSSLDVLRTVNTLENSSLSVGASSRWALEMLTGEEQSHLKPVQRIPGPYFLEPIY